MQSYRHEADGAQFSPLLERGDFDLVAVGRSLLSNPDWQKLVETGRGKRIVNVRPERFGEA